MILECCNCGMRIDNVTGRDVTMDINVEPDDGMTCDSCTGDVSK